MNLRKERFYSVPMGYNCVFMTENRQALSLILSLSMPSPGEGGQFNLNLLMVLYNMTNYTHLIGLLVISNVCAAN